MKKCLIKLLKYSLNWVSVIGLCFTITVNAQYKVLHHFTGNSNDGAKSAGSLIKYGSKLFGMTLNGGNRNKGAIFSINTDGTDFRILHSFVSGSSDGEGPIGSLLLSDSTLFGMASSSGTNYGGTLFKINIDGNGFEVLHRFSTADGMWPWGSLIQSDSILYGLNTYGGNTSGWQGKGTIFKIKKDGTGFHVIHSFNGGDNDGIGPHGTFFLKDSTLYATTLVGGKNNSGTVFKINVDGTGFQIIHSFAGGIADGSRPYGVTFVELNSTLYGTTLEGGKDNYGTVFKINLDGSDFGLLHTFTGVNNGQKPFGGLLLSGTTLYGAASDESTGRSGVIYAIENDGPNFKILHWFNKSDGQDPISTLSLSDSTLFGVTFEGGSNNLGVIFSFDLKQITGIQDEKGIGSIENFRLFQNYPNPFNPTTVICYQLAAADNVRLSIYNLLGQEVKTLINTYQNAGEYSLVWDAKDDRSNPVSSGIYFYKLEANGISFLKKMLLTR